VSPIIIFKGGLNMKYKIGEIIPILIDDKIQYSIIVSYYNENWIIQKDLAIRIYEVLCNSQLILVDESCIYNGIAKEKSLNEIQRN